jgi:hypothetical protein
MPKPILIEARYRSKLEEKVADQLEREGIPFEFEAGWVPYTVPERKAKYLPDFKIGKTKILLEAKGRFGGFKSDNSGAQERQKLILIKEQHPELDIRIVFQDARKPIYKGSKTTYAKWANDHGFQWADRGVVPKEWIKEMKQ